jgi:hypothetical protein
MRDPRSQYETASVVHLQRVAAFSFSIDHLHNLLIQPLPRSIPLRPVIPSPTSIFRHENVLRVVQTCPWGAEDIVDDLDRQCCTVGTSACNAIRSTYARFEIDEDGAWNIMLVISLVEEYVFAVAAFGRPLLEDAFFADPVFCTEALPVYGAHFFPVAG